VPATVRLEVAAPLRVFLPARFRADGALEVAATLTTPLAHVVPAAGVPLTEVGSFLADGVAVGAEHRPAPGSVVRVGPVIRPQPAVSFRFFLDVHLGALTRRLRLLGLDVAYDNDADDGELVARTLAEDRVLLTQDHALLRRRALVPLPRVGGSPAARAAHVRGSRPDDQLMDVLDRFAPPLAPFTRCVACGGLLEPTTLDAVAHLLAPGTRRTYTEFVRCARCGRPYWHGAHGARLDAVVDQARERVRAGQSASPVAGTPNLRFHGSTQDRTEGGKSPWRPGSGSSSQSLLWR
jgi:uncharacterized protein